MKQPKLVVFFWVGKSRLVEVFVEKAKVPSVYFQAIQKRSSQSEIERFRQSVVNEISAASVLSSAKFDSWEGMLAALSATIDTPTIIVIDELPWLLQGDETIEGALQHAWDRNLRNKPVLIVLIGSDVAMMDALTEYGRPLYDRTRILQVNPLSPSEVKSLLKWNAADTLDAYTIVGGFPNLLLALARFETLQGFLTHQLQDPTSPLIVSGERSLAAEFPTEINARLVLGAVGAGEREHRTISNLSGIAGSSLERALELLVAKRVIARQRPYSSQVSKKNTRYMVADPYLRFWLHHAGPHLPEIERGRGHIVARTAIDGLPQFIEKSIEPIVREALVRTLPAPQFNDARYVGSFWSRDNAVEVDLVGGDTEHRANNVAFIGSIKWRSRLPFTSRDLASLINASNSVPGASEETKLIGVSKSGFNAVDLDVKLSPESLVKAW